MDADVIPEYLIMDIQPTLRTITEYLEKGFGRHYLDINELINGILFAICTDTPKEGLEYYIQLIESQLDETDFAINDIVDICEYTDLLGSVMIMEFRRLGFYQLKSFWGYQVHMWLNPATMVLGFGLEFEMDRVPGRLTIYEQKRD